VIRNAIKSLFFVLRIALAWFAVVLLAAAIWGEIPLLGHWEAPIVVASLLTMALVVAGALSLFSYRYGLTAVVLLPPAAALGGAALLGRRA
jgi:hypothetical protein